MTTANNATAPADATTASETPERAHRVTFRVDDLPALLSRCALIGARMTVDRRAAVEAAQLTYTAQEWADLARRTDRDVQVASDVIRRLTPILIPGWRDYGGGVSAGLDSRRTTPDPDGGLVQGGIYLHDVKIGTITVTELAPDWSDSDTALAEAVGVLVGSDR